MQYEFIADDLMPKLKGNVVIKTPGGGGGGGGGGGSPQPETLW